MYTIFPTSHLGWVNLLAACGLLFILVLLWVTLHCSGFVWSLLSCFVLYVLSTMDLRLLLLFAGFHDWSYWFLASIVLFGPILGWYIKLSEF